MSTTLPKVRLFLLIFVLFSATITQGQIRIASPYSRFGIGDVTGNSNAWNSSMGGISIGISSPYHVNIGNPASYTAFDSTSFLFEGGFIGRNVKLESSIQTSNQSHGSLGYLLFGIPIAKWWRTTVGLTPFSEVGYQIATIQTVPDVGRVSRIYTGEGGINQFLWGNGFKITKNLSIGVNATYLFGNMNRQAMAIYPDSIYFANLKVDNNITINSLYFSYGLQYRINLRKGMHLTTGVTFAPESRMKATTDMVARTFFLSTSGTEYYKDTIATLNQIKGRIVIPAVLGGGFSFEKTDKWIAGADVKWQNWKQFSAFGISDSLSNSLVVCAGVELLPDLNNYTNYLKRIRYRLGATYNSTYLTLRGQHLREYAVSVGLGLPMRGNKTAINLGLQVGSRGTIDAGLIRETSLRFVIGFTIYEKWFVKRKYY